MSKPYEELAKQAQSTFWGYVGFELEAVEQDAIVVSLAIQPHHLNMMGIVHGGVFMTMLDNAMGLIVMLDPTVRTVTATMNTHFLHNVSSGTIYCKAELLHRTKRTITMTASIYDENDQLLAYASGSYRLLS